ncbi:hypothetical protein N8500_03365 [Candidatus Puniceispirillum sp.]|nr:hypothetical protein [Candidatus Puniceispirillum sp.]
MSLNTKTPGLNYEKMVRLADAAWALLENQRLDQIKFDAVADMVGIDQRFASALVGSVQSLVLAKMAALDCQSILEAYHDIADAGEVSIREKIIEGLLHRFETYGPFRRQIDQLNKSARRHPELAVRLLDGLEAAIRRILMISGDPANGLKGMLRVKGVAGVFLLTSRVWMKDDSPDLAATMKMLDQRMSTAEEWCTSLRVFALESQSGQNSNENGQDDGRYGEDND